jgi:membrane protein YdbS with pleckstrin-like domain
VSNPDEKIMCVVYQHPFGIIVIYIASFLCLVGALALSLLLLPNLIGDGFEVYGAFGVLTVLIALLVGLLLVLATFVYRQSRLTVTDRNVVQIVQKGILFRAVSQISLANVEDVTVEQKGIFSNYLNFGTLKIETAGEQANFNFSFCPNANRVAHIILEAKDNFILQTGQTTGSYRNRLRNR